MRACGFVPTCECVGIHRTCLLVNRQINSCPVVLQNRAKQEFALPQPPLPPPIGVSELPNPSSRWTLLRLNHGPGRNGALIPRNSVEKWALLCLFTCHACSRTISAAVPPSAAGYRDHSWPPECRGNGGPFGWFPPQRESSRLLGSRSTRAQKMVSAVGPSARPKSRINMVNFGHILLFFWYLYQNLCEKISKKRFLTIFCCSFRCAKISLFWCGGFDGGLVSCPHILFFLEKRFQLFECIFKYIY